MNEQIIITSVAIALLLATMSTASSIANVGGTVWSDGYVELTLNKMERTDSVPYDFQLRRKPKEGHDFVVINLTITRIENRYVLAAFPPNWPSILFDEIDDEYTLVDGYTGIRSLRGKSGEVLENVENIKDIEYMEAGEHSNWFLIFEMPKDREPARLRFVYPFTESWEKISINEGQIEIYLQVTPRPAVTPVPCTPTPSPTATAMKIPTPEEKGVPGFEVIFTITCLLTVVYIILRRGKG